MAFALGIILFILGIAISVALHEAGHLLTAKAFKMRVRRYFIGFGPTLFKTKRKGTEYGLKALPLGGFCDIAGMTILDEDLTAEEKPHAMYKKPAYQRIIVMLGGITEYPYGVIWSTGGSGLGFAEPAFPHGYASGRDDLCG